MKNTIAVTIVSDWDDNTLVGVALDLAEQVLQSLAYTEKALSIFVTQHVPVPGHGCTFDWDGIGDFDVWEPTHYSLGDDSTVRLVSRVPFVIENENGDQWEDDPNAWAEIG